MSNAEQFGRTAEERFPELRAELAEDRGRVDLQVATFASAVRGAVRDGDVKAVGAICGFLEESLGRWESDPQIAAAVASSFVEAWELRESSVGAAALDDCPPRLAKLLGLGEEKRSEDRPVEREPWWKLW